MIIGITGLKGSGKTVIARHLLFEHGFKTLNFKDALVKELKDRFPNLLSMIAVDVYRREIPTEKGIDWLFHEKPPLVRALMQHYGTEVRRADDENYWVNKYINSYKHSKNKNVVTDDVRFLNEAQAVRDLGGVIVRIIRTDLTSVDQHPSETEQGSIAADFTIEASSGEHAKVYKAIESILDTLKRNVD